jgi:hypothetical protein
MTSLTRLALAVATLVLACVGVTVMVAACVIETSPILKPVSFGLGVFIFGCGAAMLAGWKEAA